MQVSFENQRKSVSSAETSAVLEPPVLTGTVTITGTAQVGQTLTAITNALGGSGTISYQWKRGDTPVGTSSSTYKLTDSDKGSTITVTVSRAGNSGSVTSDATAVVGDPSLPALTGSVTINNTTPKVGDTLTATYSDGNGTGTATWQWYRGDTAISGTTASTYTVVAEDVGKTLKAEVSYANQSGVKASNPTAAVTNSTSSFVPVTNITGVPTSGTAGGYIYLNGTVNPSNATYKTIVWSIVTEETTAPGVSFPSYLSCSGEGIITVKATIINGTAVGTDYTQKFSITITLAPSSVTSITNVPTIGAARTPLTLTGTVNPDNAFSKTITWELLETGVTGASLSGNTLHTTAPGTVTVRATVLNGNGSGYNYTQDFDIKISPLSWTAVTTTPFSTSGGATKIIYDGPAGQKKFVAVGYGKEIAYSSDGINWTSATITGPSCAFSSVAYGGPSGKEQFIAVSRSKYLAHSTDGMNWQVKEYLVSFYDIYDIIYEGPVGGKKFVMTTSTVSGTFGTTNPAVWYSLDGETWTSVEDTPLKNTGMCIAYGNGKFVAGDAEGNIAYSTNGINWSSATISGIPTIAISGVGVVNIDIIWDSITYGGPAGQKKFVAVGIGIAYSNDGVSWTYIPQGTKDNTTATSMGNAIAYGGDRFVAVSGGGKMSYSIDGIHWTAMTPGTANGTTTTFGTSSPGSDIYGIVYGGIAGQEKFVAGGQNGKMAWAAVPSY